MPSDRKEFKRALRKFDALNSERQYSLAPNAGRLAILYSLCSVESEGSTEAMLEIDSFRSEAYEIQARAQRFGKPASVIEGVNHKSVDYVINQPYFSDVTIIGHGNFSSVFTDENERINWYDISKMTSHLKLGRFTQRFCGNYIYELSVPFGLFAVANPANVLATSGLSFDPIKSPEHENYIQPIDTSIVYDYDQLKRHHPRQIFSDS